MTKLWIFIFSPAVAFAGNDFMYTTALQTSLLETPGVCGNLLTSNFSKPDIPALDASTDGYQILLRYGLYLEASFYSATEIAQKALGEVVSTDERGRDDEALAHEFIVLYATALIFHGKAVLDPGTEAKVLSRYSALFGVRFADLFEAYKTKWQLSDEEANDYMNTSLREFAQTLLIEGYDENGEPLLNLEFVSLVQQTLINSLQAGDAPTLLSQLSDSELENYAQELQHLESILQANQRRLEPLDIGFVPPIAQTTPAFQANSPPSPLETGPVVGPIGFDLRPRPNRSTPGGD